MKRAEVFVILAFLALAMLFLPIASAISLPPVGEGIQQVIRSLQDIFAPIAQALFGIYTSDEFLFSKILLFILLFVFIRVGVKALPRMEEQGGVATIIAAIVAIFAVRYISENDLTRSILLPYGVLGLALTTILPFALYAFGVHKAFESKTVRKVALFFYLLVFFILWLNIDKGKIGDVGNYLYVGTMILAVLLLLFDRQVRRYYGMIAHERFVTEVVEAHAAELQRQYRDLMGTNTPEARRTRERILKELRRLGAELPE